MRCSSLFWFSALLHGYAGLRLLPALTTGPTSTAAFVDLFALLLVVSALLLPLALTGRRQAASPGRRMALAWVGMLTMGWFSSLLVFTLLRDGLLLLTALVHLLRPDTVAMAAVAYASALLVVAASLVATALGAWNARRTAAVVRVDVPIAGLPLALHGFTIAQISDIHVGPTIRAAYVKAIVTRVNSLQVDMVAVTGDLVDGRVDELAAHVAPLAALTSSHGSFFVTGNHEYYSGAHAWIAELRRLDITVLLNQHVVLRHGGSELVVAGVTDYSAHHFDASHRSDPHLALEGSPSDAAMRLLLAHQPLSAMAAADAGFHLQLSGHTHGGQFWPWNHFVRFQQPFTAGLHRLQDLWVYTSRGTGYWGPPKRFGAPSEITRLRLVRA